MSNRELRRINIPMGYTIRVTRVDGTETIYVFHGTDPQGGIYEDESGQRHREVGEYAELALKTDDGWMAV